MTPLDAPIPLVDSFKSPAYAHLAIDYGQEHYMLFVCFINQTGECWIYTNREVKIQRNVTMGIRVPAPMQGECSCADDLTRAAAR